MFKLKSILREGEPGQSGGAGAPSDQAQKNQPTAADIQAQIDAGIAKFKSDFSAEFEKATGHKDLAAFNEAQLKAQGKLQELADAKAAEAQTYKTKFEQAAIGNAILAASADAVDPATVKDLLAGKAKVDDNGAVTIDGKPVADAVEALLKAKPFLAKAEGDTGSGAPANAGQAVNNPWTKEHHNLTEQIRIKKENPTLAAQLKAAAGKS